MSEVFERVYNVLDSIGKFLGLIHDSFSDAGTFINNTWSDVTACLAAVPAPLVASCGVILALGIVLLILGR